MSHGRGFDPRAWPAGTGALPPGGAATMRRMEGFRSVHVQEVAFRDLDAFGHVNNAVYLTYLENARVTYMREVLGVDSLSALLVIVASVKIDFRSRASLGEQLE